MRSLSGSRAQSRARSGGPAATMRQSALRAPTHARCAAPLQQQQQQHNQWRPHPHPQQQHNQQQQLGQSRRCRRRRAAAVVVAAAAAAAAAEAAPVERQLQAVDRVTAWLTSDKGMPKPLLEPKRFKAPAGGPPGAPVAPGQAGAGERVGFIAARDVQAGEALLSIPEAVAITAIDAEKHPLVGEAAKDCSELVALALWLMAERAALGAGDSGGSGGGSGSGSSGGKSAGSAYAPLLESLPAATDTPILWDDRERSDLLQGSPVLAEARAREAALREQWAALAPRFSADASRFDPAHFNEASFLRAFSVALAHSAYLPSAEVFALLPLAGRLARTGNGNGADLDYDAATGSVALRAARPYREGQEVLVNDPRPNGEMLLCFGSVQDSNLADCLLFDAELIAADRYYQSKQQVLEAAGLSPRERFPVHADRFPVQLLAYLRLARIQDPAQFARVAFDRDEVVSQMNEYEVLQLLMGECRERLQAYSGSYEEEIKALQSPDLAGRARLAARLRMSEKTILTQFMDAVRRKLAPVRGIPTKSGGMQDPNADLKEIFDAIESIPAAPAKLFDGFRRWAKGEFDPDWNK